MIEIDKDRKKEIMVVERLIEIDNGDDTVEKRLRHPNYTYWYDIVNHEKYYRLETLLAEGWVIKDTVVSTSICCSQSGYTRKQDHTIVTLER